jgi:hypothetical protein
MKFKSCFFNALFALLAGLNAQAQIKTGLENVNSVSLRNAGAIKKQNDIRGYYFFYESDKIDRNTREYTLQVLDENLNAAKPTKLILDKKTALIESATNETSVCFMFLNQETESLDYSIYGADGKVNYNYSLPIDKKSKAYFVQALSVGETGSGGKLAVADTTCYISVIPVRDGKNYSYSIAGLLSNKRKQWVYEPHDEERKSSCSYIGSTDSVAFFSIIKFDKLMSNKGHASLLGIDMFTGQKKFDISMEDQKFKLWPTAAKKIDGNQMVLMGNYYDKEDYAAKDNSLGYGFWIVDSKGKIIQEKYNTWATDVAKFLKTDAKGRLDEVGNIHTHKMVATADGKYIVIGEGFKKALDGVKLAMSILSQSYSGVINVKTTDMVLMKFNSDFKIEGAGIYDKYSSKVGVPGDFVSTPMLGYLVAALGGFDYEFTQVNDDKTSVVVGYTDYERSKDFKGLTFHSIRYQDGKFKTDKINMESEGTWMRIMPAKAGFVMIYEYFKKKKKLEYRLEKMN